MKKHYPTSTISNLYSITNKNLKTKKARSSKAKKPGWMIGVLMLMLLLGSNSVHAAARNWIGACSATNGAGTDLNAATPNGSHVIAGTPALVSGNNYFWLAYDIPSGAVGGNVIDGEITSLTVNTLTRTPTVTAKAGSRTIFAPLSGTYTVGTGGDFATLTAAVSAYNLEGLTGPTTFNLLDASYASETYPITFNAAVSGASNGLTIKPTQVNTTFSGTTGATTNTALIVLNGADYITIDGSIGVTSNQVCPTPSTPVRNLTFTNAGTATSSAVIWLQTNASDGATNNTIKNCNLVGNGNTQTLVGVGSGSSTISISSFGTGNNSNNYINNNISKTKYGIISQGASTATKNTGTVINQNLINTVSPNNVALGGILTGFENNLTISGNNIGNLTTTGDIFGISAGLGSAFNATTSIGSEVGNVVISKNILTSITSTSITGFTAIGIGVGAIPSGSTAEVSNNMISGVSSLAISSDYTSGITIGGGLGTNNVYFNTVSMTGARGAATASSYALAIAGAAPTPIVINNNILVNSQTSTAAGQSYAIGLAYTSTVGNYANLVSNNNDLFTSGTSAAFSKVGSLAQGSGTNKTTLALWTTETGRDGASQNVSPTFISTTNLHLVTTDATNFTNIESKGVTVAVTDDIDCNTRTATPDIGADEATIVAPDANDMAATAFIDPTNGGSKVVGVPFSPQASFTNLGTNSQSAIPVRYRIVNSSLVEVYNQTGTIAGPLTNNQAFTVTFTPQATLTPAGTYTIYATAELGVSDTTTGNDEITGTITVTDPYTSSTTTQNTNTVSLNTSNQQIIGIQVVVAAAATVTSFNFNTTGSTNPATDISAARVFYTTTTNTFATTTPFGTAAVSPNGAFSITGSQSLPTAGTYYFWLAYDVPGTATPANVIDAECTSVTVNGVARTPTVTAPAGSRYILGPMAGPYLIGASQTSFPNFTNLTNALSDLSSRGVSAAVSFVLQTDYNPASETYPLNFAAYANASTTNTLTIVPDATVVSNITLTSTSTTAIVNLNGINYVRFDGRPGGTGTNKFLSIANTSTSTGGTAVLFTNEASNNILRYVNLTSAYGNAASGVVVFSTTNGANGNDDNTIDNCDINGGAGATASPTSGVAQNGIYSLGTVTTTAHNNSGNVISNNNIYDFYRTGGSLTSSGVLLSSGNTDWSIIANSFYQTAARTATGTSTVIPINISNTSGNNFTVTDNYIGGSTVLAGGTAWTQSGTFVNSFQGINLNVGTTTASNVQNNTIANFNWSSTSNGLPWLGINVPAGNVNVGTITGNTIGATTGTGSINTTISTTGGSTAGIYVSSTGTVTVQNNKVGSFTVNGSTTSISASFAGIYNAATGGTHTISSNVIGSTTTAGSINAATDSINGTAQQVQGIVISSSYASANPITISGNTVANMTQAGTGSAHFIRGITYSGNGSGTINTVNITNNTIYALSGANANAATTTAAFGNIGIYFSNANASPYSLPVISGNTIYNLAATNATAVQTNVAGIVLNNVSGAGTVFKNSIYDLRNASTMTVSTTPPTVTGIFVRQIAANSLTVYNNMISLGNSQATNTQFAGIWNRFTASGALNVYHNSVYIGGTVTSGALPSFGFLRGDNSASSAITSTVDVRDNIFYNARTTTAGGAKHYAISNNYPTASPSATGWGANLSNYNILYGTAATIGYWGTDRTFAAWQTASASDTNSFSSDPQFSDPTNATPDLHINTSNLTQVEAGGVALAVTDDFDGQTRSGLTPTDIGADAGNFTESDLEGPTITYTPLANNCGSGTRVLSATITDISGVPTSGTGLPVLYWRIGAGSYNSSTATYVSGNQYDFNVGIGSVGGDVISYYIVAQDNSANVSVSPFAGAAALTASPPTAGTPPTTPSSYTNNALPTAPVSGNNSFCAGESTTLYSNATAGSGTISSYQWNVGGVDVPSNGDSAIYSATAAGNYTVTITNSNGCSFTSVPYTVTVNASPTGDITGGETYCNGQSTTTSLSIAVTGSGSWSGTLSDGTPFSGSSSPISVSVTPSGTTTYTIATLTDANCTANAGDKTGSATVTVIARPTGVISGGATYCNGQTTTTSLSIAVTGAGPWSGTLSDGTPFSGSSSPISVSVTPSGTTTYTIATLTDANCTANVGDKTGSATVTVIARPTGVISGGAAYCIGQSTTTSLSIVVTGSGSWSGTLSDGTPFSGNSSPISVSVTPSGTTTYTIATLTDANCTANAGDKTGSATVTINPLPIVTATNVSGCPNTDIALIGSPLGGTFSITNPYNGSVDTTYTYTYTDGNGCTNTSNTATVTLYTEINFNSIDDNCDGSLFEGHAPVVVDITTPSAPLGMNATINATTATNTSPYSGAPQVTYKFKVTKTNAPTSVAYVTSSTPSFTFSSASNVAHSSSYDVQATAIVNGEEQPYNGNTMSYTTPAAPTLPNPPTQTGPPNVVCAYTLAAINSYIYANNSTTYGANQYEFLVERMNGATVVQTVSVATTVPYFKLTNIVGIPATMEVIYGTTYRIKVRYGYGATSFGSQIYTAYGTPCLVSTPALPLSGIVCGTTLPSLNTYIYTSGHAGGANQFEFKVTRVSPQQPGELPITVTEETAIRNVANFKLTMLTQLLVGLQKEYSVSVRYRINAYGVQQFSAWSTPCRLFTPDFPTTEVVEAQCGVEGVPGSLNEYIYADAVPGATLYRFRLFNNTDAPYTVGSPYDHSVYSPGKYVKLIEFPGLIAGVTYTVTVVAQLYGEYPDIDTAKDCAATAPASTPAGPAKLVAAAVFQATAYPNPFANNFMINVKTSSDSVVSLKVYDMIGRLIEQREVTVSDMETTGIGDRYPSGVYNVVVAQGENVQTVRVMKR